MQGGRYLIRKRQEIVIVIEDLCGHRIVLHGEVTEHGLDPDAYFHTLIAILRKAASKPRIRESTVDETYTSFPIGMSDSTVMEVIIGGMVRVRARTSTRYAPL